MLLSASASALGQMLAICDDFARELHLAFKASKSKCVTFPPTFLKGRPDHEPVCHIGNITDNIHYSKVVTSWSYAHERTW